MRRAVSLLQLFAIVLASAIVIAGCGSDEKNSGRPEDPKTAIEQSLTGLGGLNTGQLEGAVVVTLSGPLSNKARVRFNGPFDLSDPAEPGYSIGGTFQWGRKPVAPFGLAASDGTRYVSIGEDDFAHTGEQRDDNESPLKGVSDELSGMLGNHAIVSGEEGKFEGLQLFTADLEVEPFQQSAIRMFNTLLQPGAGSTALGGGQIQGLLETAIQEAHATFGIDDEGVLQTIEIETDGAYQILGSTQRIRIGVELAIDGQNLPVQIEVPENPRQLDSAEELDQKLADFFAEQIPISF